MLPREVIEELATIAILHDEEYVVTGGKGVLQLSHKGMVIELKDPVLGLRMTHLVFLK